MARAIHAQVAENYARKLRGTEDGRELIASYRDMIEDRAGIDYTHAIGQPYGGWTDGQVAAYSRVHYLIATGKVIKLIVPVGSSPGRDADRVGNQRRLTEGLPVEFVATVYEGNSHDGDARLSWPQDAVMPWIDGYGKEMERPLCPWADSAPLEIGYTDASRTFLHLTEGGIVARWPYGSDDIWLFFYATMQDREDAADPGGIIRQAAEGFLA
ncbi:hypothetical protein GTY83_06880 [Streptomyces sp. SID4928]|uniref:hypothetical protein n=1 Tax=Streptomyces TaxID=1883 RepID=UPI0001C1CF15|nr:hypothetical protein [Streptomyces sp. ACT-1]EGE40753.1 hypothetical protein SACT1_1388 [Streptomyces sp. ACT-1]MYR48828.1 hypothetical protein [Streptomyces sp. SID4928]